MVDFCVRNWFALLGEMGRVPSAILSLEEGLCSSKQQEVVLALTVEPVWE